MAPEDPAGDYSSLPGEHVSMDRLVAVNMRFWRREAGLTQGQLGDLTGWTVANISAMERSAEPGRPPRRFDADSLITLARALQLPVAALLLPPPGDGIALRYIFEPGPGDTASMADLVNIIVSAPSEDDTPAMAAYRRRYAEIVDMYLGPGRGDELAAYAGDLASASARARMLDRIASQRAALAGLITDLDQITEAIARKDTAHDD